MAQVRNLDQVLYVRPDMHEAARCTIFWQKNRTASEKRSETRQWRACAKTARPMAGPGPDGEPPHCAADTSQARQPSVASPGNVSSNQ